MCWLQNGDVRLHICTTSLHCFAALNFLLLSLLAQKPSLRAVHHCTHAHSIGQDLSLQLMAAYVSICVSVDTT